MRTSSSDDPHVSVVQTNNSTALAQLIYHLFRSSSLLLIVIVLLSAEFQHSENCTALHCGSRTRSIQQGKQKM